LIARANPDAKEEKRFLGYEFSKKRGSEGIKLYKQNGKHQTALYDEDNLNNAEKLNFVVRQMLLPELYDYQSNNSINPLPLSESFAKQARVVDLTDCFDFLRIEFEKQISLTANTKNRTPISSKKYEQIPFTRFATLEYGSPLTEENRIDGEFPVVGSNGIVGYHNEYIVEKPAIIVGRKGSMGKVNWINANCFPIDTTFYVAYDQTKIKPKYLYYLLLQTNLEEHGGGIGVPGLNRNEIHRLKFPLPPLDIQQAIVKEIETVERAEESDRKMIEKRRNEISQKADDLFVNHSLEKLGRVCELPEYGAAEKAIIGNPQQDYRYIRITDVNGNGTLSSKEFMTAENIEAKYILQNGDFLFARSGATVGKTFLYREHYGKAIFAGYFIRFRCKSNVLLPKFLDVVTKSENYKYWVSQTQGGSSQPNINAAQYSDYQIPLPSIKEQERVIAEIGVLEKQITEAEKRLSQAAEQKNEILRKYL
jgi:type I restriction enzyme S subunit